MPQMVWESSKIYKGVRWYIQNDRQRVPGNRFDRCYGIRYTVNKKRYEAVLGWTSEGWSEEEAAKKRQYYIDNIKVGKGPISPKDEQEQAEKLRREQERRERVEAKKNITFKDFTLDEYFPIALTDIKPGTARDYQDHAKKWIFPVVGNLSFQEIGLSEINKIKKKMQKKGRAPRTQQAVFRTLTMIWNGAQDADIIEARCPTKKKAFKLPKVDNKKERFLTFDEADKLLDAVRARSEQTYKLSLLSLHTGMRFGECAALTWQCVDMSNSVIKVLGAKGDKSRAIEMGNQVKEMFESMESGKPGDLVFPGRKGQLYCVPSSFKRAIHDVGLNDGITDRKLRFGFHGLRHTRASWLRRAGAGIATIQSLLGHSSPAVTARYAHVHRSETIHATAAVDQMIENEKTKGKDKIIPIKKAANNE